MDNYRLTIKKRLNLCRIIILLAVILISTHQFGLPGRWGLSPGIDEIINFQMGLLIGFIVFPGVLVFKYRLALGDEKKLRKLHNSENDERKKYIRQKSGASMVMITSGLMILSGIISGYFNQTVFYTLILAAAVQMGITAVVKVYLLKKI